MQRVNRRTWRALFFFLKTSIVNAYLWRRWGGHPNEDEYEEEEPDNLDTAGNRKFREALIESLWLCEGETGPTAPEEDSP